MAPPDIKQIGKYEVTDVLGQGGMGIVYKGVDPGIGRAVAIKMMTGGFAENPDLLKRFQREAQSAGTLQHPNIVIIYELGTHEGNPYMAMEYISGESLESMVHSRKRMSLVEKVGIMIQILNGLNYAHQHGIVHRDIKPGNIMVLKDGMVKIVDFGIARISDNSMTKTGQIVGTINYMSPEQFNGHVVDGRSDIFSSGVLFYEFLTNALPFDGAETPSVILKILNEAPPPLKNHLPNFPAELEEVIHKALAKDREERYATAEDFAFDLGKIQEALKKDMVLEYVEQAKAAFGKQELNKAKELLLQVLKVDAKHEAAKELMKQVQEKLSQQQRAEQVKQLRSAAEDALAKKELEEAISYVEQALKLDKANTELLQLQKLVGQAKLRKDQIEKMLERADHLREDGDLDSALRTAEDALAMDPKDTQAHGKCEGIRAEIKKQQLQKEINALVDAARKEISEKRFTSAMEMVRKSEALAPMATQSGSLRNVIAAAREQESRRISVERLASVVEVALHKESLAAAEQRLNEANRKFPSEPVLAELQDMLAPMREAAGVGDRKKVAERAEHLFALERFDAAIALLDHAVKAAPDEAVKSLLGQAKRSSEDAAKKANASVAEAQKLLKAGKVDEAAALLEAQPHGCLFVDAFYASLESARAEQDKHLNLETGVMEARTLMLKGDVNGAWNKAKALLQNNPTSPLLQTFLKDLEQHRAALAKEAVEKAMRDARALILARQNSAATRTLQAVQSFVTAAPPELQKAFATLQSEISTSGKQNVDADANKTIVHGSAGNAQGTGAGTAVAPAQSAKTIIAEAPKPAPAPPKPFPTKMVAGAVLGVVLLVGSYFGYKKFLAPPPVDAYIQINATPWAMVRSVESANGKVKIDVNQETPVRVPVPSGEYTVTFTTHDGKTLTEKVSATTAAPGALTPVFEGVSANEIVQSSN